MSEKQETAIKVALKIKELMLRKDVGYSDIFEETKISRTTLSGIANAKTKAISFDVLERLAKYFEVEVKDLF